VWEANHEPGAYILAPRTAGTLAGFRDSTDQPLRAPDVVAALRGLVTNQVPIDRTQSTAGNASNLILGDFNRVMIGTRKSIGIEMLRERYADNLQIRFLVWTRIDVQLAHVGAYAPIVGIIP
jgi:HK97 family phage major capsid protein